MEKPTMSEGLYQIRYENGTVQKRHLVQQEIYQLLEDDIKKAEGWLERLKKRKKEWFSESFFTTESPLGCAINTGVLVLPAHEGGVQRVEMTLVD